MLELSAQHPGRSGQSWESSARRQTQCCGHTPVRAGERGLLGADVHPGHTARHPSSSCLGRSFLNRTKGVDRRAPAAGILLFMSVGFHGSFLVLVTVTYCISNSHRQFPDWKHSALLSTTFPPNRLLCFLLLFVVSHAVHLVSARFTKDIAVCI